MEQTTINAQKEIIDNVKLALKTCSTGIGMSVKYDIERKNTGGNSTLIFTPKPGYSIDPKDFFWLGYFVGRDYEK